MEGFLDELDKASEGSRRQSLSLPSSPSPRSLSLTSPSLLDTSDELKPVGEGVTDLLNKLSEIDREIRVNVEQGSVPGDGYNQKMLKFLRDAKERLEALNDKKNIAESNYNALLRYFGEDPMTASNTFFGIFKTFVTSYKVSLWASASSWKDGS